MSPDPSSLMCCDRSSYGFPGKDFDNFFDYQESHLTLDLPLPATKSKIIVLGNSGKFKKKIFDNLSKSF